MRIDLREKINRPLIRQESNLFAPSEGTRLNEHREGLIQALLDGYRAAEYIGYVPDSLDRVCTWDQFDANLRRLVGGNANQEGASDESNTTPAPAEGGDDSFGGDDFGFGDEEGGFDDFGLEGGEGNADGSDVAGPSIDQREMFAGMRFIMEVVEDRIFDKNKNDMYYDIHYLRLIWVDPEGIYPYDVPMIIFKFEDVIDVLEKTQWKNWYNDAEYRSMLEVFQLRLFHGFIVDVSGNQSRSTDEAEKRRQQMIEFEHHLWEF